MFLGQFKFNSSNGSPKTYNLGDVVINQGRVYECKKSTVKSPTQDSGSWTPTGLTEIYNGENPPTKPVQNQLWVDGNGIMYVYYKDSDGFQWIAV